MTITAILLKLCVSVDYRTGDDKPFKQTLRACDRHHGAGENHPDREHSHEVPGQWRASASEEMRCEDVDDGGDQEKVKQRQMEDMP